MAETRGDVTAEKRERRGSKRRRIHVHLKQKKEPSRKNRRKREQTAQTLRSLHRIS